MKIISSGFEIYKSGILLCPELGDTNFILSESPKMHVVLRVKKDASKSQGLELEVLNEFTLAFIFTNPEGLGYGNSSPVKIGHLNGREIFASFHINMKSNNSSFELGYTFMFKELANV